MKSKAEGKTAVAGFTLIELMVVVAIIGVLASIAIPKFADMVTRAKEAAILGHLGSIRSAINVYYADQDYFPGGPVANSVIGDLVPTYLGVFPSISIPSVSAQGNPGHSTGFDITSPCPSSSQLGTPALMASADSHVNVFLDPWIYIYCFTGSPPAADPLNGQFFVNCAHTSSKGNLWTTY